MNDNINVLEGSFPLAKINLSQNEKHYQSLWQAFYQSITIESRFNPKCRMSHMPKRFWTNLTEFQTET